AQGYRQFGRCSGQKVSIDATFVFYRTDTVRGCFDLDATCQRNAVKRSVLQVRQKAAFGLVVRVGNVIPDHWAFACDFTTFCHGSCPYLSCTSMPAHIGVPRRESLLEAQDMLSTPPSSR